MVNFTSSSFDESYEPNQIQDFGVAGQELKIHKMSTDSKAY